MAKRFLFEVWRWSQLVAGWLLMVLAPLVGGPLPGPFGVIGFAAGLILVLRNSRWARRLFIRIKRRYPGTLGPVRRALRPGANLSAILGRVWKRLWVRVWGRRQRGKARARAAGRTTAPLDTLDT
ncbi:MAG TPA: hypothetical protein VKZ46_04585 [Pedomonas sp.]|nr:hypothetical protein [Pedomonas sp.]